MEGLTEKSGETDDGCSFPGIKAEVSVLEPTDAVNTQMLRRDHVILFMQIGLLEHHNLYTDFS